MKKLILEALTTKFRGVAASLLGRIADKLAKTVTTQEEVATAVEGVTIQQLIESESDRRATEASTTAHRNAIAEYEKRYGLKDGIPTAPEVQPTKEPEVKLPTGEPKGAEEQMPAWAKVIFDRLDRYDSLHKAEGRRTRLEEATGQLPESLKKAYSRLPIDKYSDEDFEQMLTEVGQQAQTYADTAAATGGIFGTPKAGNAQPAAKATDAEIDALADRLAI